MASQVAGTDGAIGYFELSFAKGNKIPTVRLDTGAPKPVTVSAESASAGIAAGHVSGTGKDMTLKFDYKTKAADAYPSSWSRTRSSATEAPPPKSCPPSSPS